MERLGELTASLDPRRGRGQVFTRYRKALALSAGDVGGAIAFAERQTHWGRGARDVVNSLHARLAAVTPSGTDDMPPPTPAETDFSEFLRPMTILGKLTGLRRAPSRVRLIVQTAGSTAYWSGERNPRPISRSDFAGSTIEQLSVVATTVCTRELISSSAPSAESILSRDLAGAGSQAMDEAFIDRANNGIPGVKPMSVTAGAPTYHSSGETLVAIDSDLALLIQSLSDAGSDLSFATFILTPRTALSLSQLRGSGGALAFPGMTAKGGVLAGLPAITSAASPSAIGSPTLGAEIVLLDPSQILVTDDGGAALELGLQTAIAMEDAPGAPSTLVSMWQTFSAALKMTRYLNWQTCRAGMVQVLDQVSY